MSWSRTKTFEVFRKCLSFSGAGAQINWAVQSSPSQAQDTWWGKGSKWWFQQLLKPTWGLYRPVTAESRLARAIMPKMPFMLACLEQSSSARLRRCRQGSISLMPLLLGSCLDGILVYWSKADIQRIARQERTLLFRHLKTLSKFTLNRRQE